MAEDRGKTTDQYRKQCICDACPTYNECLRADESLLFCFAGKSGSCTFDKKGCLCPTCPVTVIFGWKKAYFCIKGTEQEQP
jgi:hypothetical protein